jgi:hypothetical protein
MPLKKRSKILLTEADDPKKNVMALEDLEDNNKSMRASLTVSGQKLELLKKTLREL